MARHSLPQTRSLSLKVWSLLPSKGRSRSQVGLFGGCEMGPRTQIFVVAGRRVTGDEYASSCVGRLSLLQTTE